VEDLDRPLAVQKAAFLRDGVPDLAIELWAIYSFPKQLAAASFSQIYKKFVKSSG
jgi:hypothetical protein